MSCKCFFRLIVCAIVIAMTILTIISLASPLLTRTITSSNNKTTTALTISFANIDNTTTTSSGMVTKVRTHTRDVTCQRAKSFFLAAFAMMVVSAICGGLNVFCAVVWVMAPCGFPIGVLVFFFTLVCFVGTLASFVLMMYPVTTAACSDAMSLALATDENTVLLAKVGYVVLLVAFIGLLVALVMQLVGCCCGCQLERSRGVKARDATIEGMDRSSQYSTYQGTELSARPYSK